MKHIKIILGLILLASVSTFAQSPRIKLNQITKDSLTGSVLISSPSDSGMVYSRDLFISYGTDTFLILGGDTLAATSSIISSVLSDGVTITGDGTTGSELTVDTATVIATKGDLSDYVNISGTETITGAKTFTTSLTVNERIFVNAGNGNQLYLNNNGEQYTQITFANNSSATKGALYYDNSNSLFEMYAASGNGLAFHSSAVERMRINSNGNVGIGTTGLSYKLDVNGNVRADTYYYDVTSTLQSSSDSRLKQNITDMDNVLDKLKELELVKYEWNDNMYKKLEGRTSQSKLGGTFEGMIAQQVESLFPQYVGEDADGYKTLSYVSFVIPLLKGFQEQQAIIESQATEIETLKTLITDLSNRLQILENN